MKFLLESVKHLEVEQVPKFLKSVLKSLVEIKGHQKVDEMWTRSGLSISQLLPSNKLDKLPEIIKDTVWIILASLEFYWKKTLTILIPYLLVKFPQQKKISLLSKKLKYCSKCLNFQIQKEYFPRKVYEEMWCVVFYTEKLLKWD